jgi:hypothetical protein
MESTSCELAGIVVADKAVMVITRPTKVHVAVRTEVYYTVHCRDAESDNVVGMVIYM